MFVLNLMTKPVFRFAPSPNGYLHLGHAYSAILNHDMARNAGGTFLLRMEDIDTTRCKRQFEEHILDDLKWLGLSWDGEVRRQSEHFDDYRSALESLEDASLVYPSFMSRGEIRACISEAAESGKSWPVDPDGAPLYPGQERYAAPERTNERINAGEPFSWRLNTEGCIKYLGRYPSWKEDGTGPDGETGNIYKDPSVWGDVIIARKETPTSYHLSVVVDDAIQGVTHVVRGIDLFHATSVHRLLQELLGLDAPMYHHHPLILDTDGRKLSKSRPGTAIADLRKAGHTPNDIRRMIGLA